MGDTYLTWKNFLGKIKTERILGSLEFGTKLKRNGIKFSVDHYRLGEVVVTLYPTEHDKGQYLDLLEGDSAAVFVNTFWGRKKLEFENRSTGKER